MELHPQRANTVIRIILVPFLRRGTDGMPAQCGRLLGASWLTEQAWRPRPCGYAHRRSGSPRVPVRPYYEGPPSQEGRYGPDEGWRKPPGSRGENPVRTRRDGPG